MAVQNDIDRLVSIKGFTVGHVVSDGDELRIRVERRERIYRCWCGQRYRTHYDRRERAVRDLSFGKYSHVLILFDQCRVRCSTCGVRTERLDWVAPRAGYSNRLAEVVAEACRELRSIRSIAHQYRLHWSVVKKIDREALQRRLPDIGETNARLLMIDEFAIKSGQNYGTLVADALTGEALFIGYGRKTEALAPFFEALGPQKCGRIQAIAMDAWRAYARAKDRYCPQAAMVYDQFHLMKIYSRYVLDRVRIDSYQKASQEHRPVIKGTKYLLLKNRENLSDQTDEKARLHDVLAVNQQLNTVYVLKEDLKQIWRYKRRAWAEKWLDSWIQRARESGIKPLIWFTKKLIRHRESILAHCTYPLATSKIEGMNNKVKLIKRIAFGFKDFDYFALKIRGAFRPAHTSA